MKRPHHGSAGEAPAHESVVVIGNFDGVHRGHQAVLEAVGRVARERQLAPKLLTFEPHPAVTLGRQPPALLTRLARKIELCERACPGIEVVVREFTTAFAAQTPAEFAERVLTTELGARAVMVGLNFRFGRGRSGGTAELEEFGRKLGFELLAEPLVCDDAGPWSSSRVRQHIASGDVEGAMRMLGRPHMVSGVVAHGDARGRTIGFPTCNLPDVAEALPPNGVYAVLVDRVTAGKAEALAKGVANLGVRPTVRTTPFAPSGEWGPRRAAGGEARALLEVHLFDVQEDLYGAELRVHLLARLREEQRFAGLDELRAQIARDAAAARVVLAEWQPDEALGGAWS
jgi:riboflavin kinase / FMN adenylyltransferase